MRRRTGVVRGKSEIEKQNILLMKREMFKAADLFS